MPQPSGGDVLQEMVFAYVLSHFAASDKYSYPAGCRGLPFARQAVSQYRFFSFGDAMFIKRQQPLDEHGIAEELKELEELDKKREAEAGAKE